MTDKEETLAESTTAEAANAVAVAEEARLKASAAQLIALQKEGNEKLANIVATTMKEGFRYAFTTDTGEQRKFVDTSQIHRICDDIASINKKMETWDNDRVTRVDFALLKQQSDLTNKIVLGACAFILFAFLAAFVGLVVMK